MFLSQKNSGSHVFSGFEDAASPASRTDAAVSCDDKASQDNLHRTNWHSSAQRSARGAEREVLPT